MAERLSCVVIGGGIVGIATAYTLLNRFPGLSLVVLEKEQDIALHQTGRNSGVLHSGIYYSPGSLKAKNCIRGKALLEKFIEQEGIAFQRCGKVIIATSEEELPRLQALHERALKNGIACTRISADALREIEPHARGLAALHVPGTGIVSFRDVAKRLADRIRERGGEIRTASRLIDLKLRPDALVICTDAGEIETRFAFNCGGLFSDRIHTLAAQKDEESGVMICPFRGEYYLLKQERIHLCRGLIYPVPDPRFPFLGVHFTRRIDGTVDCGPNAVLAFAREGYSRASASPRDMLEMFAFPGTRRFLSRHWRMGLDELLRSFSKARFARALQQLVPDVREEDLVPTHSGVRAQAIRADGTLVDDFLFRRTERMVHVLNAPSPAATSCLSIAETVIAEVGDELKSYAGAEPQAAI